MKEYTISSGTEKNASSQVTNSTLNLEGWTRYFRYRHLIKPSKNKMDSKLINSHPVSFGKILPCID